jgi:hypothetical protein
VERWLLALEPASKPLRNDSGESRKRCRESSTLGGRPQRSNEEGSYAESRKHIPCGTSRSTGRLDSSSEPLSRPTHSGSCSSRKDCRMGTRYSCKSIGSLRSVDRRLDCNRSDKRRVGKIRTKGCSRSLRSTRCSSSHNDSGNSHSAHLRSRIADRLERSP